MKYTIYTPQENTTLKVFNNGKIIIIDKNNKHIDLLGRYL